MLSVSFRKRSKTLPGVSSSEMGLCDSTLYCDCVPLGMNMIMACFQALGMYPRDKLWLQIVLYVRSILRGRCLRWYEVMPEAPGALGLMRLNALVMYSVDICGYCPEKTVGSAWGSGTMFSELFCRY